MGRVPGFYLSNSYNAATRQVLDRIFYGLGAHDTEAGYEETALCRSCGVSGRFFDSPSCDTEVVDSFDMSL